MRKYKAIYFIILLSLYGCADRKKEVNSKKSNLIIEKKVDDSASYFESDTIFKKEQDSYLKIGKVDDDFLKLDYKLKKEEKSHSLKIRYFTDSDIIFPKNGIGILNNKKTSLERYSFLNDSILVLPILGVNNTLSTYIIDLKNEVVLDDDVRTSLSLVWIRKKEKSELIFSDTPQVTDSTYKYILRKYVFEKNKLNEIKVDSVLLKYNLTKNLKKEFKLIRKF
ncbi:hypothetical protein [Flavobacterium tistrianum]|uniref:hypothetical protein n=1 Tax=Flavobacterium tistrianum TaxID=1685414 RepID=UPI000DAC1D90|nr:hypothetical protein [Flavobacterium tistrianum]KAF2342576.1 hypothetical protein DMB71_02680 [Flavobacterium tistrianum]